ncbi:hypothetical protein D3C75_892810 [compost metagenome]
MVGDNLLADHNPQAGAVFLAGQERLPQTAQHVPGNTGAMVRKPEPDPLRSLGRRLNPHYSPFRHGFHSIFDHIQKYLLN